AAIALAQLMVDDSRQRMMWIAGGVVLAGGFQIAVVAVAMHRAGVRSTHEWRRAMPLVSEIVWAMIPVVLATSVTQLNSLLDSLLAWGLAPPSSGPEMTPWGFAWPLETGTASALYFAQRMYQFPLGVFGIALGTVLFPLLARHSERGEHAHVGRNLTLGVRLSTAIGIPATVGLILLREPIAVMFFERGAFTAEASALTARCIAAYGLGVWAAVGMVVVQRGFFVLGDRRTPVKIGMQCVGVNVVLNLPLLWAFAGAGLALATSIAAIVQYLLTAALYHRRTSLLDLPRIARTAILTSTATAMMAIVCWAVLNWLRPLEPLIGRSGVLLGPLAIGTAAYFTAARLIGLDEPFILLRRHVDDDA
ncbi:MAG: polysaccharide biosynthesis C-terminal domain-containing protein, partial [Planctomycetaceae bacterium]|nr:polysaccharide biosynthesis C-terminal domain-containing protein [Planctomycetaceae bacterium]